MKRPHFALPEIYDDSLSYYDVLRKLIKSMHAIVDNLNKIPEQIANEAKAREQVDSTLQINIDNEAMARQEADNELRELISTSGGVTEAQLNEEVTARQQGDTVLDGKISELKSDLANKLPKSPADWEAWTAEEQAAARGRMGFDKPFELIEEILLSEDTERIERKKEPDGTPYNFKKVFVSITSNKSECGNRTIYTIIHCGSKYGSSYINFTQNTSYFIRGCWRGAVENNELRVGTIGYGLLYGSQGSGDADAAGYKEVPHCIIVNGNINSITIQTNNQYTIPAGFLVQIYGVRA